MDRHFKRVSHNKLSEFYFDVCTLHFAPDKVSTNSVTHFGSGMG